MALISLRYAVQVFVIINILINIVHGNPTEEQKCLRQIKKAFGSCYSSKECLQYAIRYYVYDFDTASTSMNYPIFAGQSSGQEVNDSDAASSSINHQIFTGQSSGQEGSSINHQIFAGQSSGQEGPNINDQLFDDQMFDGLEIPLNFDGLRNFIESDPNIKDRCFDGQSSGQYGSNEQMFNEQEVDPVYILEIAKQYHCAMPTVDDGIDYAREYHKELFGMITGSGVPRPVEFCAQTYYSIENRKACREALVHFGNFGVSAVKWAFKRYTLAECEFLKRFIPKYEYITKYMETIIEKCKTNPSKKPISYCQTFIVKYQGRRRN